MAKSRAQRKAEQRARQASQQQERQEESRAQHATQVPESAEVTEAKIVEQAAGAIEAPAPSRADRPPAAKTKPPKSKATKAPAAPKERRRGAVLAFLASSWAELKRVQWPDRETLVQASAVTVVFVAVAAAYLGALDAVFSFLVKRAL